MSGSRFRRPSKRDDEERILPLIDVVFLLLAFFMVAGRLGTPEPLAITPPRSTSEVPAETGAIVVRIDARGRMTLDRAQVQPGNFAAALADRLAVADAPLTVQLEADAATEASGIVAVLEELREAVLERLALVTVPAIIAPASTANGE